MSAAREKHPKCTVAKDWSLNTSFWIFDNAFKCEGRVEHHWLLAFDHLLVNCVIEVSNLKCRQVFVSSTITISQPVLARLQKKLQISSCQNFVKFPPILVVFGRKMAKRLKLCQAHSISISPISHHQTTMLNANVPNNYTTLKVVICNKHSSDLISTQ